MAATTKPKKKVADVLRKATLATRTVSICVAGELAGEHEDLVAELEKLTIAAATAPARLGGNGKDPAAVAVAERIQVVEAEMAEATYDFRFRALSSKAWSDLLAAHPDPKRERMFAPDTFVPAAIAACCVDPEGMDDPEQAAALFESLSAGQQDELFSAAWEVNQTGPKGQTSSLASALLLTTETISATA